MTDVIFSFDTEDYINPKGADGIVRTGRILREAGMRGCYNVVARLAGALVKWGRQDAIDELRRHEIETHSMRHSHHPTICEYTDIADHAEAIRRVVSEEGEALERIRQVLGNEHFYAACPPGSSHSYAAHYGWSQLGLPVCNGDCVYDPVRGRPVSCCNMLCMEYRFTCDDFIECSHADILARMEQMSRHESCIVFHHPQKHVVTTFCDLQNFNGENREGEPVLSDLLPQQAVERFEENLRFFTQALNRDPRFRVVTFADVAHRYAAPGRVVRRADIPAIKKALDEDFFPLTAPDSLCLSDLLLACRDLLLGRESHTCGRVYGFLDTPYAVTQPVQVSAQQLREAAVQFPDDDFLPTSVQAGGLTLGPADWLRAALCVLSGQQTVTLTPGPWQIDLDEFPALRDLTVRGTWIHAASLEDRWLSDRYRLQSWTIRLPAAGPRRIF